MELEDMTLLDFDSAVIENEFDQHYGLIPHEQTVLVRAYSDDSDDRMLAEIRPKFIVMFEPNMEFIRRIEVSTFDPSSISTAHGIFCDTGIQEL
jgi:DNA excision repair protein ERCC-4